MKTRFVYQILYNNAALFLYYLRVIDQRANQVEDLLHETYENKDLIQLYDLEKCLVYFTTALKSNEVVLEKFEENILALDITKKMKNCWKMLSLRINRQSRWPIYTAVS